MKTRKLSEFASVAALFLALPAFAQSEGTTANTTAAAQGPSDAEIAHIVVTANQVDIDAGKWAETHAHDAKVKKFAKRMVVDHTDVNKQAMDLAKKLKVTPKDNETSMSLKKGGDENVAKLKGLKGHEFDKEYVDHEVAYHEAVMAAINNTLEPNAKNAELKALIVKVKPAIQAHLDHAKHLQASMSKGAHK